MDIEFETHIVLVWWRRCMVTNLKKSFEQNVLKKRCQIFRPPNREGSHFFFRNLSLCVRRAARAIKYIGYCKWIVLHSSSWLLLRNRNKYVTNNHGVCTNIQWKKQANRHTIITIAFGSLFLLVQKAKQSKQKQQLFCTLCWYHIIIQQQSSNWYLTSDGMVYLNKWWTRGTEKYTQQKRKKNDSDDVYLPCL